MVRTKMQKKIKNFPLNSLSKNVVDKFKLETLLRFLNQIFCSAFILSFLVETFRVQVSKPSQLRWVKL